MEYNKTQTHIVSEHNGQSHNNHTVYTYTSLANWNLMQIGGHLAWQTG